MDKEFVFASEHLVVINEERDGTYLDTLTPACDFCLDVRTRWDYPCKEFVLDEIGFASSDGWLACERCAELIEKQLLPELTARAARSWIERMGALMPGQIDQMGQIQQGFFDHREGERVAYG